MTETYKIFNPKTLSYACIALGLLFYLIVAYFGMRYNVDSIYDEAFLFFNQKSAINGNIAGMSQGTSIIASILGDTVCSTILGLRTCGWWLKIICVLIFTMLTCDLFGKGWKHFGGYFLICMLMIAPSLYDIVLCHNGLAQFFLCIAIALGYRILVKDSNWNYLCCICVGISCVYGIFSILPSALLLMVSMFILLLLKYWRSWKILILYIGSTFLGLIIGITTVHYFVVDIPSILVAMNEAAQNVTTLNRGYDPMSFLIKFLLFIRDWVLCIMTILGGLYISNKVCKTRYNWFASVILLGVLIVYSLYQQKPQITFSMLLSVMWLLLLFNKTKDNEIKYRIDFNTLLNIFLIMSPIILSIGTNTYLGGKMRYFMLPWAILLYRLGWNQKVVPYRLTVSIFVTILLCLPIVNTVKTINSNGYLVNQGPLEKMYLTNQQNQHFELCDSIMSKYDFKAQESVIYTTQLGMMTVCYLDGINCANYFQPMDFVAKAKKSNLPRPDFMFLCDYDIDISGKELEQIGWGWPEEFDVYDVGSPETVQVGYPTTRKLYCRKSLRQND